MLIYVVGLSLAWCAHRATFPSKSKLLGFTTAARPALPPVLLFPPATVCSGWSHSPILGPAPQLSSVAWLSMLMSAFLGVLALGVVLATFYVMRSWSMWLTVGLVAPSQPGEF